ncbi:MAG: alpha/beta hydrolase [Pseudomonadota bacterium]
MAMIEPITGRYITLEVEGRQYRTYFEEAGEGPAIVCLHTAGADSLEFRHLLNDRELADRYRLIAFDLPYHGRSLPPEGWWNEDYKLTRDFYVAFTKAFCDGLGLDQPILLGCSMGGYVMFDIARDHPDHFSAFIGLQARDHEPAWSHLMEFVDHPEVNANTLIRPLVASVMPATAPETLRKEIEWIYMRGAPGLLAGDFNYAGIEHDSRGDGEALSRVGHKLYVIAGDWDWSCTEEHTAELTQLIRGVTIVRSPDLGHFPMSENPPAFRAALDQVLSAIEALPQAAE